MEVEKTVVDMQFWSWSIYMRVAVNDLMAIFFQFRLTLVFWFIDLSVFGSQQRVALNQLSQNT